MGEGYVENVPAEVWAYEVSGKQVLRQWFSYRKRDRDRPMMGDRRPPSPLGKTQPDHWLAEYTTELLNVLHVLGRLVLLEPAQQRLLEGICAGPLLTSLPAAEAAPAEKRGTKAIRSKSAPAPGKRKKASKEQRGFLD
ncbi:MAG: type ISP restriction/modification enzyme [Lacipirellulaceae bacterium]